MSLVLNTNASGGGWYTITNEFIDNYPDVKNSILMCPVIWTGQTSEIQTNATITSLPAILNVNWTPVNFLVKQICFPEYLTWINWTDFWWRWTSWPNASWNCTFRYWFDKALNWWETVWKKIIFPICAISYSQYAPGSWIFSWTQDVKLLHTDWTLTSVWSCTIQYNFANWLKEIISWWNYAHLWMPIKDRLKVMEFSWVVAQQWDLVVVDCSFATPTTTDRSIWLWFWRIYSTDDSARQWLLQISID